MHEAGRLRLTILGNPEILREAQTWVVKHSSVQYSRYKWMFGTSDQNLCKNGIKVFYSCQISSNFSAFQIYFDEDCSLLWHLSFP